MFYMCLNRGQLRKSSCLRTTKHRALIFIESCHLEDFYHVCSNAAPGSVYVHANEENMLFMCLYGENIRKSSCLKSLGLEP